MKRTLVALLALAACVHADRGATPLPAPAVVAQAVSGFGPNAADWRAIRLSVRAVPLAPSTPDMVTVGLLRYRGGVEIASDDTHFGGLSDLYVDAHGRLLAASDQGDWFAARVVLDDAGALVGLADGQLAAMRGEDGQPLPDKEHADAEDLTRLPDGRFAVSFERTHTVRLYDLAKKGPAAPAEKELALAGTDDLDANDSLEAISAFGDELLIGAEGVRTHGSAPFWIAPLASDVLPAPVGRTKVNDGYGLVALDRLPDGDFVAMERFFAPLIGPRIFIRRVTQAGLTAGPARWEGETIADLNPPVALDNFEGLAITHKGNEPARIYIISDDNFSRAQKTLLYAFDLVAK